MPVLAGFTAIRALAQGNVARAVGDCMTGRQKSSVVAQECWRDPSYSAVCYRSIETTRAIERL